MARVAYHALHEEAVAAGGVHAPPEDARLLDGHLTVARRVEGQERHLELPRDLGACEERAPHGAVGAEANDRAVELPARDGAGRTEAVHGVAVPPEPGGHHQLGSLPVRLFLQAEARTGEGSAARR